MTYKSYIFFNKIKTLQWSQIFAMVALIYQSYTSLIDHCEGLTTIRKVSDSRTLHIIGGAIQYGLIKSE